MSDWMDYQDNKHTCSPRGTYPRSKPCKACVEERAPRSPPGTTKPITPDEVASLKARGIPGEVFAAFNEVIARHWTGSGARFTQDEVMSAVLVRMPATTRQAVFDNHWLDVETAYEAAGWTVVYDKPGYNESGPATFMFTRKA